MCPLSAVRVEHEVEVASPGVRRCRAGGVMIRPFAQMSLMMSAWVMSVRDAPASWAHVGHQNGHQPKLITGGAS